TVAQVKPRNPLLYALVDFLITGLGLIVQGRVGLGALFLGTNIVASLLLFIPILGWILFFLILLPVWIISMAMAFTTAKNWNHQHVNITCHLNASDLNKNRAPNYFAWTRSRLTTRVQDDDPWRQVTPPPMP